MVPQHDQIRRRLKCQEVWQTYNVTITNEVPGKQSECSRISTAFN